MFKDGFIKNKKLLEEISRIENLIDLDIEIEKFFTKINLIEYSSLIGFIGKFGSGKSNFLNQIKNKYDKDNKWINFDAWRYPERENLWENFVLEFARQIDEKTFDKTIKKIDGRQNEDKKTLINTIGDIPLLSSIKNFNHFFNTTPAKRIFEVENVLKEIILKVEENNIFIIIEDIDRSGDNGVFFLETLNYFLKNNNLEKKIICIVPIGKETYEIDNIKLSYIKALDYTHEYFIRNIGLKKFVEKLFIDEIAKNEKFLGQISSFMEGIFKEYPGQITMRELKLILRNANINYISLLKEQGEGIDWRLVILFETGKYIKNKNGIFFIEEWKKNMEISTNSNIFSSLIGCVFVEGHKVEKNYFNLQSIYESEIKNGNNIEKPISFPYDIPIKIINKSIKNSEVKDSVWYTYNFEKNRNYAGITSEYLYI